MFRMWGRYLKPYWLQVTVLVLLQIIQAALNLYLPNLQADIINKGVAAGDESEIYTVGWQMVGISGLQICAAIIAVFFSARLAMRLGYEIRRDFFSSVEDFSLSELDKFSSSSLVTRVTNDAQRVSQTTYQTLMIILQAPVMFIGGLIMAIRQDGPLTWSLAVILPVILIVIGTLMGFALPLFSKIQKSLDSLNSIIREQISGVRVVRAFTREDTERKRFNVANTAMYKVLVSVGRLMSMAIPLVFFVVNISNVSIMWFGGMRVDSGAMQIGSLQAFIQYLMVILISIMMAAMMSAMLPRASVSARRLMQVLNTSTSITAPEHPYKPQNAHGVIEFKDVTYSYPGAGDPVISHVSFKAEPGKTTAFIGSTGAGKSTLLRLAMRQFDVTSGQVLVDNHDVREYDPLQLATEYGIVPQKAMLFSGTIRSNLQYGKENATDDEMWDALKVSQSYDFVKELPEGLDAPVSQGGSNFSGGQKQRLCIARAIVRHPNIYTFDDSFSALDMATDRALRMALKPITAQSTVLLVAQRAASIRDADTIIVLDSGKIVGTGTHDELMQNCTTYKEIVESQGGQGPDVEDLSIDEEGGR